MKKNSNKKNENNENSIELIDISMEQSPIIENSQNGKENSVSQSKKMENRFKLKIKELKIK